MYCILGFLYVRKIIVFYVLNLRHRAIILKHMLNRWSESQLFMIQIMLEYERPSVGQAHGSPYYVSNSFYENAQT